MPPAELFILYCHGLSPQALDFYYVTSVEGPPLTQFYKVAIIHLVLCSANYLHIISSMKGSFVFFIHCCIPNVWHTFERMNKSLLFVNVQ